MFQRAEDGCAPPRSEFDWHDVRFIGAVAGRYTLPNRRAGEEGRLQVYACRLCSISTRLAVLIGPVVGDDGEQVAVHFEQFGVLRGSVVRKIPSGFAMRLSLDTLERDRLGRRIIWHKKHSHEQVEDRREHKRLLPRDPNTRLTLADGTQMPCFVIDVSQSGAAVSANILPDIGTPMAVGKMVGRVVRHLDVGFAVQFIKLQEIVDLEALIAPPTE
jgi:hypothetical protein